ncbi:hypothetical protein [Lactiplantibacillus plantarum]|uniref:hypothetical protein n=1 Tax=Lactiplantibacillus plantarum TaxID=1590 RepID=UPI000A17EB35|nr:hypothetical protein [Lactiplantibacillus plantarum]ARK33941.1 hypothetical protein B5726_05725 [Lactiplantibacillus plantarum]QAR76359.1 hypothetical protein EQH94_09860 [Lactiplantibacillus plantarum]QAS29512.1 hypothetical protein EQK45_05725 [Lactiplantibacillus plantarum]QBA77649.1 hypothetical protein EVE91_09765 [Lactiplantibacillus plantarum]RWZ47690.1 hypothetical protein EQJ06_05695 [Lactiplantibacillus plantarum]
MQEVSILPVNEWKRAQKKPSLVSANDGLMEQMINTIIYSIPKHSRLQAKRQKYSLLEWITRVGSKKTIQGVRIC